MSVRIIAKLDVKPPVVVKPVHFEGLRKLSSPSIMGQKYYQQGADEILYIDIVASLYQRGILFDEIEQASKEIFVPFVVGGGIQSIADISKLFHVGADKVAINTHALQETPELIDQAAKTFGSQAISINIEAKQWDKNWECYTDCGRIRSNQDVIAWVKEVESRGAGEILLQSVDRDGRKAGFDKDLIAQVKNEVSIPVIACSGAGKLSDIKDVIEYAQPNGVAIASILHYDEVTIKDIKKYLTTNGIKVSQ
jgi:cyclase